MSEWVIERFRIPHEHEHDCRAADCDVILEVPEAVVALALVDGMRRNPAVVYCRRRGCRHNGAHHTAAGCMYDRCGCHSFLDEGEPRDD